MVDTTPKKPTVMLWDLDGTLYPETAAIKDIFKKAAANGVREVVDPRLSDDEVQDILKKSRREHGDSFTGLVNEGHSLDNLHESHHRHLDHTPIERNEELIAAMRKAKDAGIRHAILTHGHQDWVWRVLKQVGIDEFFTPADVISVEQIGFLKKHKGPEAFTETLKRLGVEAEDTVMVEDKAANLIHPAALGMQTALINEKAEQAPHIHYCCKAAKDVIEYVLSWEQTQKPTQIQRPASPG